MAAKGGRLEARVTFTANQQVTFTDSVGAQTVTWVAGSYYLADIVSQANTDLIRSWSILISDGEGTPATVSGLCALTSGANYPYTVTFTSTQIRDILGFAGNIASTSSPSVGTLHCKGLWLPGVQHKWSMYGDSAVGSVVSTYRAMKSATGITTALSGSYHRVHRDIRWDGVTAQRAMAHHETYTGESFEAFYLDCTTNRLAYIPVNPYVRLIFDADVDATYAVGRLQWPANFDLEQFVPGWTGRYRVALPTLVVES